MFQRIEHSIDVSATCIFGIVIREIYISRFDSNHFS